MYAASHREGKGPSHGLARAPESVLCRDTCEHGRDVGVGGQVRKEPIADPRPQLLAVDHGQVDRLTRREQRARESVPLRSAAG